MIVGLLQQRTQVRDRCLARFHAHQGIPDIACPCCCQGIHRTFYNHNATRYACGHDSHNSLVPRTLWRLIPYKCLARHVACLPIDMTGFMYHSGNDDTCERVSGFRGDKPSVHTCKRLAKVSIRQVIVCCTPGFYIDRMRRQRGTHRMDIRLSPRSFVLVLHRFPFFRPRLSASVLVAETLQDAS